MNQYLALPKIQQAPATVPAVFAALKELLLQQIYRINTN